MSGRPTIADADLHAFIDGELVGQGAQAVRDAAQTDHDLGARIEAFANDRRTLAAAYTPVAEAPVPHAWIARIEAATAPDVRRAAPHRQAWRRVVSLPAVAMALAACLALGVLVAKLIPHAAAPGDTILAEAAAARTDTLPPTLRLSGTALQDKTARDTALRQAVGLPLHVPDLSVEHWQLAELETYRHAAALRYRSDTGQVLTVYVRPSGGVPRFDLLRDGTIRTCIWQDEVVGAVMMGDMSAGKMMRVASAAYLALNL